MLEKLGKDRYSYWREQLTTDEVYKNYIKQKEEQYKDSFLVILSGSLTQALITAIFNILNDDDDKKKRR